MNSPAGTRHKVNTQNVVIPEMKTVYMDMHLEFEQQLLKSVGTSIDKTKRRLHEAELTLNLKPPDDEPEALQEWKEKCEELINRRETTQFPTLFSLKQEFDKKALMKSIKQNRNRMFLKQKMDEIFNKQTEMIRKKVLSKGGRFGSLEAGQELRTIDKYEGCNSIHGHGQRVLIRKEGAGAIEPSERSLPPWFGPQYYSEGVNRAETFLVSKDDRHFQVPFKSSARSNDSSNGRSRVAPTLVNSKRFEQMRTSEELKQPHEKKDGGTKSYSSSGKRESRPPTAHLQHFDQPLSFEKLQQEGEQEQPTPKGPLRPRRGLLVLSTSQIGSSTVQLANTVGAAAGPSVVTTAPLTTVNGSCTGPLLGRLDNEHRGDSSGGIDVDSGAHEDERSLSSAYSLDSGESSEHFIHDVSPLRNAPLPLQWSRRGSFNAQVGAHERSGKKQRGDKKWRSNSSAQFQLRNRQKPPPPRLNPLAESHAFALRLAKRDKDRNFFQVKDYTMDALALQDASAVAHNINSSGDKRQQQHEQQYEHLHEKIGRTGLYAQQQKRKDSITKYPQYGRFTSDIFNVKAPEYAPPKKEPQRALNRIDHNNNNNNNNNNSPVIAATVSVDGRTRIDSVSLATGDNVNPVEASADKAALASTVPSVPIQSDSTDVQPLASSSNVVVFLESDVVRDGEERAVQPAFGNAASTSAVAASAVDAGDGIDAAYRDSAVAIDPLAPTSDGKPRAIDNMRATRSHSRRGAFTGSHSPDSPAYLHPRRTVQHATATASSPIRGAAYNSIAAAADDKHGLSLSHINLASSSINVGQKIRHWCKQNGVILRASTRNGLDNSADAGEEFNEKRISGSEFLASHRPMQPIALSLTGLLLDENPYTPEDEFIKDYFHRDAKDVGK